MKFYLKTTIKTTWQHMFEWIEKQILKKNKVSE